MAIWIPLKEWHFREWHEINQALEIQQWIKRESIILTHTSWITSDEVEATKIWIKKILHDSWINKDIKLYGNYNIWNWEAESVNWYIKNSLLSNSDELYAEHLSELITKKPFKNIWNQINLMVVEQKLIPNNTLNNNITWYWMYPTALISTNQVREVTKWIDQLLSISALAAHELWHVLWAWYRTFNLQDDDTFCHCNWEKWICIMQSKPVLNHIKELTHREKNSWLCEDCIDEIQKRQKYVEYLITLKPEELLEFKKTSY